MLFDLTEEGVPGDLEDMTVFGVTGTLKGSSVAADEFQPLPDGSFLLLTRLPERVSVFHVRADMSIDPQFANDAESADLPLPLAPQSTPSLAVLPDGRFYLGAIALTNPGSAPTVTRFLPEGTIDPVFGSGAIEGAGVSRETIATVEDDVAVFTLDAGVIDGRRASGGVRIGRTKSGTLLVGGTSDADAVSLFIRHSDGRLVARVGGIAKSFKPSSIKRIRIYTYGGEDSLVVGDGVRGVFVDSGADKDTLMGGRGNDTLLGNTGADLIQSFGGDDSVSGGGGNDSISGGSGNDMLAGNGGKDTLVGGAGDDILFGGPSDADTISGGLGNDLAAQDFKDKYSGVETLL